MQAKERFWAKRHVFFLSCCKMIQREANLILGLRVHEYLWWACFCIQILSNSFGSELFWQIVFAMRNKSNEAGCMSILPECFLLIWSYFLSNSGTINICWTIKQNQHWVSSEGSDGTKQKLTVPTSFSTLPVYLKHMLKLACVRVLVKIMFLLGSDWKA